MNVMDFSKVKLFRTVEVVLRLPGVILLEMLYMESITLSNLISPTKPTYFLLQWNIDIILYILAWLLILLPNSSLVYFYSRAISCASMVLSHILFRKLFINLKIIENYNSIQLVPYNKTVENIRWVDIIAKDIQAIETSATVMLLQFTLALLSCRIIDAKPKALLLLSTPLYPWLTFLYTPTVLCESIAISYIFSCLTVFVYYFQSLDLFAIQCQAKVFWIKIQLIVRVFGWQGVVTWIQDEYQIQRLLITCWFLRYILQLIANLYFSFDLNKLDQTIFNNLDLKIFDLTSSFSIVLFLFFTGVQCLTTTINLFGLACIVKDIVKLQYFFARWVSYHVYINLIKIMF